MSLPSVLTRSLVPKNPDIYYFTIHFKISHLDLDVNIPKVKLFLQLTVTKYCHLISFAAFFTSVIGLHK